MNRTFQAMARIGLGALALVMAMPASAQEEPAADTVGQLQSLESVQGAESADLRHCCSPLAARRFFDFERRRCENGSRRERRSYKGAQNTLQQTAWTRNTHGHQAHDGTGSGRQARADP